MVYRLQERQLETHPVVHSIADVLIDSLLDLLGPYEVYLKQCVGVFSSSPACAFMRGGSLTRGRRAAAR